MRVMYIMGLVQSYGIRMPKFREQSQEQSREQSREQSPGASPGASREQTLTHPSGPPPGPRGVYAVGILRFSGQTSDEGARLNRGFCRIMLSEIGGLGGAPPAGNYKQFLRNPYSHWRVYLRLSGIPGNWKYYFLSPQYRHATLRSSCDSLVATSAVHRLFMGVTS